MTTGKHGNRETRKRRRPQSANSETNGATASQPSRKRQRPHPSLDRPTSPPRALQNLQEQDKQPSGFSDPPTLRNVTLSKFPEIETGPHGYRSPTNFKTFPLPVMLPEWLTEPNICLPALPVISDPGSFRTIVEANLHTNDKVERDQCAPKDKGKTNFNGEIGGEDGFGKETKFMKLEVSEEFKNLAFNGDEQLTSLCNPIIWDLFGESNRFIIKRVCDDWYSNHNWLSLALVYRLDLCVGVRSLDDLININNRVEKEGKGIILDFRKNLTGARKKGQKLYLPLKFWADCWEAYWMGVIYERKLWDEDMEDIKCFFRRLLIMKYRKIMHLTMDNPIHHTFAMNPALSYETGYSTTTIVQSHKLLDAVFRESRASGAESNEYGHLVTYPEEKSNDPEGQSGITRFGIVEKDAAAELLFGLWAGCEVLPSLEAHGEMGRARAEAEIRQRVFDIMISEWSGNPRPLSRERLQSALDELRPFRSELAGTPVPNRPVDKASNSSAKEAMDMKSTWHRDKIIAMSFWYESRLTFLLEHYKETINALLCVLVYALLRLPQHKSLLRWCILRIGKVHARWWFKRPAQVVHESSWNVVLQTTLEPVFDYGTLMYRGREVMTWGTPEKIRAPNWNALAVQFDEYDEELLEGGCTAQRFLSLFFNSRESAVEA